MAPHDKGRASRQLTLDDAIHIWYMLWDGWLQSRIAAYYDVNSGRISEINTGKTFPQSRQIALARRKAS